MLINAILEYLPIAGNQFENDCYYGKCEANIDAFFMPWNMEIEVKYSRNPGQGSRQQISLFNGQGKF